MLKSFSAFFFFFSGLLSGDQTPCSLSWKHWRNFLLWKCTSKNKACENGRLIKRTIHKYIFQNDGLPTRYAQLFIFFHFHSWPWQDWDAMREVEDVQISNLHVGIALGHFLFLSSHQPLEVCCVSCLELSEHFRKGLNFPKASKSCATIQNLNFGQNFSAFLLISKCFYERLLKGNWIQWVSLVHSNMLSL